MATSLRKWGWAQVRYRNDDVPRDGHALLAGEGGYVDKLLRAANPAGLPVGQPTKFELVINLKTANDGQGRVQKVRAEEQDPRRAGWFN